MLLATGCFTPHPQPDAWRRAEPLAAPAPVAARAAALDPLLKDAFEKDHLPGLAVGVVDRHGLVWSRSLGEADRAAHLPITDETRFGIGSVTKVFTALLLISLRDAGKVTLDTPVSKWVPELELLLPTPADGAPITARHLTTHTSGLSRLGTLPDYAHMDRGMTEDELVAGLKEARRRPPGQREVYSNLGVALLAVMLGRVEQRPYRDLVAERLLQPLGMAGSTFDREGVPPSQLALGYTWKDGQLQPTPYWRLGAAEGMGGLYSSVRDLSRLVAWELSAWPARDEPDPGPVRRASLRESHRLAGPVEPSNQGVGLGWVLSNHGSRGLQVWHNGGVGGYESFVWLSPETGVGFIALANTDSGGLDDLAGQAWDALVPEREAPARIALRHFVRALSAGTPEAWKEAIAPAYLAQIHDFIDGLDQSHLGHCELLEESVSPGASEGKGKFKCEQGPLWLLEVAADEDEPYRVASLRMTSAN